MGAEGGVGGRERGHLDGAGPARSQNPLSPPILIEGAVNLQPDAQSSD